MKRIMISQPMKGKANEQIRNEREELVNRLSENYEVVDSIVADEAPATSKAAIYYLSKSIEIMSTVDTVYFMKGWENARGCKIEHEIAEKYELEIIEE